VKSQRHSPSSFAPRKTQYLLYSRLGGYHGRSGQVGNISPPPGFDPRTVQPVAQSLYQLSYPAHKSHLYFAVLCITCGLLDSTTFFAHYLTNGTFLGEKSNDIQYVLSFSLELLSQAFLFLRRVQRPIIIYTYVFKQFSRYSCHILMELEFSRRIFGQIVKCKIFKKITLVGVELFRADRQTDGRTDRGQHVMS
jgi:hypothetical protein